MNEVIQNLNSLIPFAFLLSGLSGSLHCVGMCGGLVTATSQNKIEIFQYQMGRLFGYLLLGFFAGVFGSFLNLQKNSFIVAIIPGTLMGILFIYWGIQSYFGKKSELPFPKFFKKFYFLGWNKLKNPKSGFIAKSLFVGFMSIFLPCGLLYGIVLGLSVIDHTHAMLSMFLFWLGTLPAMVFAPSLVRKILNPMKIKLPKIYALVFISIGLITISGRSLKYYQMQKNNGNSTVEKKMHCH